MTLGVHFLRHWTTAAWDPALVNSTCEWWLAHSTAMLITEGAKLTGIQCILKVLATQRERAVNTSFLHRTNLHVVLAMLLHFTGIKRSSSTLHFGMMTSMRPLVRYVSDILMKFRANALTCRHIFTESLPRGANSYSNSHCWIFSPRRCAQSYACWFHSFSWARALVSQWPEGGTTQRSCQCSVYSSSWWDCCATVSH